MSGTPGGGLGPAAGLVPNAAVARAALGVPGPVGAGLAAIPAGAPLGASPRQTAEVACPRSMVGRVIGKNGETIKALQIYTGCLIQIDQSTDPTRVTISGTPQSLSLAINMVTDICKGTFKGFALLRQLIQPQRSPTGGTTALLPRPVYAPGYGLIPPSQLYGSDDAHILPTMPTAAVQLVSAGANTGLPTLQPGFQYVQTTQLADGQIMLGVPQGLHAHALGQPGDGPALLSTMPIQQLQPLQQVYGSVALPGGGFTTQVAYHPTQDLSRVGAHPSEQLLAGYSAAGAGFSLSQAQLGGMPGTNTGKMLMGGAGGAGGASSGPAGLRGAGPAGGLNSARLGAGGSGSGWVEGGSNLEGAATTMGQAAVDELLGGTGGSGGPGVQSSGLPTRTAPGTTGSAQQQLVQVISPEGQISYYLQGGEN